MNVTIHFTPAAISYIEKVIAKENGIAFRLSVKKTGCSGYAYLPSVITETISTDQMITMKSDDSQKEVKIFIDTAWLDLLGNLHVDYIEEDKLGLKQKRLVFTNPKEGNRCGCGESFQIGGE